MRFFLGLICIISLVGCSSNPKWKSFPLDSLRTFTNEASLLEAFGKDAFVREVHEAGNGYPQFECIRVWPDTDHTVEFAFDENQKEFVMIILRPNTIWQAQSGIRMGMNIAELEKRNGGPFTFDARTGLISSPLNTAAFDPLTSYFIEGALSLADTTKASNLVQSDFPAAHAENIKLGTMQLYYQSGDPFAIKTEELPVEIEVRDSLSLDEMRELPLIPLPWIVNKLTMPYNEYDPEKMLGLLGDTTDFFIVVSVGYRGNYSTTSGMRFIFRTYDKQGQFLAINNQFILGYEAAIEYGNICSSGQLDSSSDYTLKVDTDWSISADDLFIAIICDMRDSIIMKGNGRFEAGQLVDVVIDHRETKPNNYLVQ
jgi:hypothetical protein